MKAQFAVDVGYGFTKVISDEGRRHCFPSVCLPARGSGDLAALAGVQGRRHLVELHRPACEPERLLVGEAALAAGGTRSWNTEASRRPDYARLVLAAAALAGAEGAVDLAVGLPVATWAQRAERRALREQLQGLAAWAAADGEEARYVEIAACRVLPQAMGAYFAALHADPALARGRYGIADVGFRTADLVLLVPDAEGVPVPDDHRSTSLDVGLGLAYETVRQEIERGSGVLVDEGVLLQALQNGGQLRVRGISRDLRGALNEATRLVAERVEGSVRRLWADQVEFLDGLLLAGGGAAALLPFLHLAGARLVPDGIYANAAGFLRYLAQTKTATA